MLRVIRRIKETAPLTVKANFLGAHAVGHAYKGRQSEYVDLICNEMLPAVAAEGLADFVDVFCDTGFFTVEETDRILSRAAEYGITPKIHANELEVSGGVQVGVKHNALSVDHLEKTTDAEIEALRGSRTMPTMLPGCSFFLGLPYGRASCSPRFGLQSWIKSFRQHAICNGTRLHQDEAHTGAVIQRLHHQFRLCDGRQRHPRLNNEREESEPDNHQADSFPCIYFVQSSDPHHRKSHSIAKVSDGASFGRFPFRMAKHYYLQE